MLKFPQMPEVQYEPVALSGGFDQVTSSHQLPPGALRDCINFACRPQGGYYRIPGYERFDGRAEPHLAGFIPVGITLLPGQSLSVGNTGSFGNINGTVSYVDPFGNYVGLTKTSGATPGTFVPGDIVISAVVRGTATSYFTDLTIKDIAVNKAAAANIYRADIGVVPGSGPIRGVAYLNNMAYAFRDNAGGTACVLHKSSPAGWAPVTLGKKLSFTAMSVKPVDGSTLTEGGVTATIGRTAITSGDLTGGTAAGYFIVSGVTGGSFTAGAATYPGGSATLSGAEVQIALAPGGTYNMVVDRFGGGDGQYLYGADGVNDAFEFDGAVYVPLPIDGVVTKPHTVTVHSDHLFLMVGSSVIHSAIGNPYNQEVINGAGEIALKGLGTDMSTLPGNQGTSALAIFTNDSTWILYGSSSADWKMTPFNMGVGAKDRSVQNLFDAFLFDERGMSSLKQSLNYGNFDAARLTYNIAPLVKSLKGLKMCSGLGREDGQYRVFFDNGYGIYTTVNQSGVVGHGVVLFTDPVLCNFDASSSDGETVNLFGTSKGYVMRNDVGTSFDGARIAAFINTNVNTAKTPRLRKRFRRLILEMQGSSYVDAQIGYSFDWASARVLPHAFMPAAGEFSPLVKWDEMIWDTFFWDGKSSDSISVGLDGSGENVQMLMSVDSDYTEEFTVPSVIFHYTPRRGSRG